MAFFTEDIIRFFIELAPNNNKDWFDLNRKRYEQNVKEPFKNFVQHLIGKFASIDPAFSDLEPKDCIFRINRDIRFSKDKSPYKLMVSAVISPGGKKNGSLEGVYIEISPEHFRVYGGVYETDKDGLELIREGIATDPEAFKTLYSNQKFAQTFGEIRGEKNKILPKELKEAGKTEPLLYNKQWYFFAEFEPETILNPDVDQLVLECYQTAKPLEDFFNRCLRG